MRSLFLSLKSPNRTTLHLIGSLRSEPGFFPAYHMNKDSWITVSLDNKADADKLKMLLDMSYTATASKIRKKH